MPGVYVTTPQNAPRRLPRRQGLAPPRGWRGCLACSVVDRGSVMTLAGLRHLEELLLRDGVERDHHELPVAHVDLVRRAGLDHDPGRIGSDRWRPVNLRT